MRESWVFGGNDAELGRGLNHLPYTAFVDENGECRLGVGIGACVLDLRAAAAVLPGLVRTAVSEPYLNALMALGPGAWAELRAGLQFLLSCDNRDRAVLEAALLPLRELAFEVPCRIGDYTDFYASRDHARRVGEKFRPDKPLLENYDWIPIAYHGRASSIVASGAEVRRPNGQMREEGRPRFGPSEKLDYELELGFWMGVGNDLGEPVPIAHAREKVFGVSLLNDWSARDMQAWEYQPLGPFLGKNFCTTVSPWITPMAALGGSRVPAQAHNVGLLEYLDDAEDQEAGGLSLDLQVAVNAEVEGRVNTRHLYWTAAQMVAHHTSNGCNLRPGDLLGSGTVSGPSIEETGCLLELGGEFLHDGDEVVMTGAARTDGELPIQFGECRGRLIPAPGLP